MPSPNYEKELQFEKGLVKPDQEPMGEFDDVPELLRLWEKSQESLRCEIPPDQCIGNEYLTEKKLVEVILKCLHPSYSDVVDDLKFKTHFRSLSKY